MTRPFVAVSLSVLTWGELVREPLAQCQASESAKLTASDPDGQDEFGRAVAVDGHTALVGAQNGSGALIVGHPQNTGSVYVFEDSGSGFVQTDELTGSSAASGDQFGFAVALDGGRALLGARQDDLGAGQFANFGSAYFFEKQGLTWVETQKITGDISSFASFGQAVALSGDAALVGAPQDAPIGTISGSAYFFEKQGASFVRTDKVFSLPVVEAFAAFGTAVALSGNTALVGAPNTSFGAPSTGSVFVYARQAAGWVQTDVLTASDGASLDGFGASLSLAGDVVLIGAPGDDDGCPAAAPGCNTGSVYVFERALGVFGQVAKLTASDAKSADQFGTSVSVDGSTALVGAGVDTLPPVAATGPGAAYLFRRTPAGAWVEVAKLTASDAAAADELGDSVSISGSTALVGARRDDDGASNAGSAYVFDAAPVAAAELVRLGTPPNPAAFLPGATSAPIVGAVWDPVVDHTSFLPLAVVDLLGISAAPRNEPTPFGTLLVDVLGPGAIPLVISPPGVPFAIPIPLECRLIGASISTQGASLGPGPVIALANALDITLGIF